MANQTLREVFSDIADAIRTKEGTQDVVIPADMKARILALPIASLPTITYRNRNDDANLYQVDAARGSQVHYEYPTGISDRIIKSSETTPYYAFRGWTLTKGSGEIYTEDGTITVDGSITLYPVFEVISDDMYSTDGVAVTAYPNHISISRGGYYYYGNIVIIDISAYFNGRFTDMVNVVSGFPKPTGDFRLSGSNNRSFTIKQNGDVGLISWNGGAQIERTTIRIWGVYNSA